MLVFSEKLAGGGDDPYWSFRWGVLGRAQGLNGLSFKQDLYINVVVMVVNELLWDVIREMKF